VLLIRKMHTSIKDQGKVRWVSDSAIAAIMLLAVYFAYGVVSVFHVGYNWLLKTEVLSII
jgi:hypothetical protein